MRTSILSAAVLSFLLVPAASALPAPTTQPVGASSVIDVDYKSDYKRHNKGNNWNSSEKNRYNDKNRNYSKNNRYKDKYANRYYHGDRYWGHRYNARPSGWQTLGCVAVGPLWYCP